MFARHLDPIVAVATAPGRGGVGIVRVSGRGLAPLAQALCRRALPPRMAVYGPFWGDQGEVLDQGLALFFPAPHSYTGEDVLELQAHGGPVLLQLLVARCLSAASQAGDRDEPLLPRLRLAEPGEFTQRAFLNDKLDLAQAEAVSDLIDASTEAAARSASRSLTGAFSADIEAMRQRLVDLRILVEATLDFPEEEIDFLEKANARGRLADIDAKLRDVLAKARQGALLREGLKVVLAGLPNVGKSSLLNALAGAELAIVTPIPGTTRDKVSQTIQIEGVPLHVIDTAGLRSLDEASDEVERIGIARSWAEIEAADAVIFLHDLTRLNDADYQRGEEAIAQRLGVAANPQQTQAPADTHHLAHRVLHVFNKADQEDAAASKQGLYLSAKTGVGLDALRQALLRQAGWQANPEGLFIARTRHVQALHRTADHLAQAQAHAAVNDAALDLFAEELRLAHNTLGEITGAYSPDDLLGDIFGKFCIGK